MGLGRVGAGARAGDGGAAVAGAPGWGWATFSERKPFRKFGAIEPPMLVVRNG